MPPLIIAHRGASAYALENTSPAFQKALEWGVDGIEFDIRESLDGQFFVIHDPDLRRISGCSLQVAKTSSAVLRSCPLRDGQRLLTLGEALDLIPCSVMPLIEVKTLRNYSGLAMQLRPYAVTRSLMLASFDLTLLGRLQQFQIPARWGGIARSLPALARAQQLGIHFSDAWVDYPRLNPVTMEQLRRSALRVFAWTVDQAEDIKRMLGLAVDGIISNKPDLVKPLCTGQAQPP